MGDSISPSELFSFFALNFASELVDDFAEYEVDKGEPFGSPNVGEFNCLVYGTFAPGYIVTGCSL